jgi:hypothetical protein
LNKYEAEATETRKQRKLRRMCLDKRAYKTKEAAYQKGMKVYLCPHCRKWHRASLVENYVRKKHVKVKRPSSNTAKRN